MTKIILSGFCSKQNSSLYYRIIHTVLSFVCYVNIFTTISQKEWNNEILSQLSNQHRPQTTYSKPTTTVLQPLYRSTCMSQHLQLRTGDFVGAKLYCPHALVTATSAFGLGRRCWSSPQQCYLQCLRTFHNRLCLDKNTHTIQVHENNY